ncbi:centrosomal protein of 41 kDa-like isoform X3 [Ruditapes philippinarum]|uniref:centrosomal protein of 41 kDa-like isoform X3 n=1 Tax=Ruditapes philippinarum TaxID=129788 RepID=UPI00295AE133|nr:centrosomal protein of 41 kDa-like isoform X3 [Ruditapes philippinarum]
MPKKGNPTHSDSNFKEPKPTPRIKLFKEDRHNLFDILKDADKSAAKRDYNFKTDEIFRRMKVTTFVQLIMQVAEYDNTCSLYGKSENGSERPDTADDEVYRIQRGGGDRSPAPSLAVTEGDYGAPAAGNTGRSTLQGVIKGEGELDRNREQRSSNNFSENVLSGCPYLLLDVRDEDSFKQCHIITAKNYPSAMLSRACNYETKDMLAFKNQPGKIIVVYDETENLANHCATTLYQRGYDNLFLLSGGMKVAYKIFPEGLLTGTPSDTVSETPRSKRKPEMADRDKFTADDLAKIDIYLNNALCDKSSGSRLSKASTAASRMSNNYSSSKGYKTPNSVASGRASHQTPFKP